MRVSAHTRSVRVSAQKCRLVADLIRSMHVAKAIDLLEFSPKKSAKIIQKTLFSAIANAENNHGLNVDDLYVQEICIDKAGSLKRHMARAKGRGARIEKQTCHVNIVVGTKGGK